MTTRTLLAFGASALLLGGIGIASANGRDDPRAAAAAGTQARAALTRHDPAAAVVSAERAVAFAGQDASYRVLLGQSYLAAGRFASARDAFADALVLTPGNGRAALNLALMQIATGDWSAARRTLDEHGAGIAPADRGLATALAGDPAGAVAMLTPIARSAEATPKLRQNLALSLALAGRWPEARSVAATDLSPADVDARIEQWASFARPQAASDQVAALLDVRPVADAGQPARLALATDPSIAIAATTAPAPIAGGPVTVAVAQPAEPVAIDDAAPGFVARTVFAQPREVVQPLSGHAGVVGPRAALTFAGHGPIKVALSDAPSGDMAATRPAKGSFFVQLGAFRSAAVAHDAWGRATHRLPALSSHAANEMSFARDGTRFTRLSVGGFSRGDADALCRRYRTLGGACFVRAGAGDQIASWVRPVQVASR